jgi:DNA repair photolyase
MRYKAAKKPSKMKQRLNILWAAETTDYSRGSQSVLGRLEAIRRISSQGIRVYVSVMATLKFYLFFKLRE